MFNSGSVLHLIRRMDELILRTPQHCVHVRIDFDAWTLAEIVGHLIDSAANNHQRFVRLRFGHLDDFPGYDAEPWVAAQGYDTLDFSMLCALWSNYNSLLLNLASSTQDEALGNSWRSGDTSLTLAALIEDYYAHMKLHVDQYEQRLEAIAIRSAQGECG
jgi:hypothetical protein